MSHHESKPVGRRPNRREFTTLLAGAAASLIGGAGVVSAGTDKAEAPHSAATAALAEVARSRFGKFLSREQLEAVRRSILSQLRTADYLRRIKLTNGDEPAFHFRADLP